MDDMPVYGTIASQFNDPGMNTLYKCIIDKLVEKTGVDLKSKMKITKEMSEKIFVIPPSRVRYLSEISESNRAYDKKVDKQVEVAQKLYGIYQTALSLISSNSITNEESLLIKTGLNEDEILKLIEDNAECVLSTYKGKMSGSFGAMSSYSFENSKHISCGEGGMIITNDEKYGEYCRKMGCHGFKNLKAGNGSIKSDKNIWQKKLR